MAERNGSGNCGPDGSFSTGRTSRCEAGCAGEYCHETGRNACDTSVDSAIEKV
jgi:hypothetical protein